MTFFNFISCINRTYFSTYMYNSKFLLKKPTSISFNENVIFRLNANNSKIAVQKPNIRSVSYLLMAKYSSSTKIIFCVKYTRNLEHFRCFRTSERRYLHPALWVVLRPVLKFLAVITGRSFRRWWRDLPPNKKKYFIGVIKENRNIIMFSAITFFIVSLMYYATHIEETPITKRKRFMAFSSKQLVKINQFEFQQIMMKMKNHVLPANHPYTFKVKAIVNRIVAANQDIKEMKDKQWGVAVINSSVENAFVLPIGYVFVFTGMLSLCSNDDELGTVLAHEIAHCIQSHGAENISFAHLLDLISIIIIAAIWAIIPSDSISLLTHWLYQKSLNIFFELPYNRKIETEADTVGLQLAAKACFDVRESSAFWSKMAIFHKAVGKVPEIEFLSTHPSHEKRSEYLDSIMDEAINLRRECGCPKLKQTDPRLNVVVISKALEAAREKYFQQYPKPIAPFHI